MTLFYGSHSGAVPSTQHFSLHTHQDYELYYFLGGECEYVVEGARYPLQPHDLLFISPGEMHRVYHKSNSFYDRIIINIPEEFFEEMNCREYLNIFKNREKGTYNKISAEAVRKSGIKECFSKLEKYTDNFRNRDLPVAYAVIMEILYLMNNVIADNSPTTNRIQQVISYINSNFAENITLSSIADVFFISKSHLAREFHTSTGHTITYYINKKRLDFAVTLIDCGNSFSDAADKSGFGDYSSFYRAFRKEYSCSPQIFFKK